MGAKRRERTTRLRRLRLRTVTVRRGSRDGLTQVSSKPARLRSNGSMNAQTAEPLPLVYACSGCSSAAQMTNQLALWLDRRGEAEMSCIVGVGGEVPALTRVARSGRRILALDGCAMACVRACLARVGVEPDRHLVLTVFGVKKEKGADFDLVEAERVLEVALLPALRALRGTDDAA
jgi:uncharacterized metal-binding protein